MRPTRQRSVGSWAGRFPKEPLRTLDALHLATAAVCRDELGPLTVVSLDHRVRDNALALGFDTVP